MNAEIVDFLKHFDNGFSKKISDYATNTVLKDSKYIFVQSKGRQQYGYCTSCNSEFPTHLPKPTETQKAEMEMFCHAFIPTPEYEKKKHGQTMKCPKCDAECHVRYANTGHSHLKDYGYFVYYEKSKLDPRMIVARGIYCWRDYTGSFLDVETKMSCDAYYLFSYKQGGRMVDSRYSLTVKSTVFSKMNNFGWHTARAVSCESIKSAVKDTPFAWSGWEMYKSSETIDYVKFFDLYARYPAVEYLVKLGHKSILDEKLNTGSISHGVINWRGKDLLSVLKLSKTDYSTIKQNNIKITSWFLILIKENKKNGWGLTVTEIAALSKMTVGGMNDIEHMAKAFGKYMTVADGLKYCLKQRAKNEMYSVWMVTRDWEDYIKECKQLNIDTSNSWRRFPNDLYKAHQKTLSQIEYSKNKALDQKIRARLDELKEYRYENDTLLIRPAESAFEIVAEGKALNHCVGQYAERHAKGECSIFFIREQSNPNMPYYTLELRKSTIIQCRGLKNCAPTKEVEAFIKEFTMKRLKKKKQTQRVRITVPA